MQNIKFIVEKHTDGCIAYPIGVTGIVVGEGDTEEEALTDAKSALKFHIETFGDSVLEDLPEVLDAFVTEAKV